MMSTYSYKDLIGIDNIFQAWDEFKKGKLKKKDVMEFYRNLEDNLFELHRKLKNKTYRHGSYEDFYVNDPKRRHIHKAKASDRIVHHLLYKYLYRIFDKTFIHDSYSCRLDKGTHKAVKRLAKFARKVSKNYTIDCWVLKCDIKKFFASVDHKILLSLLSEKINDKDILELLEHVITSYNEEEGKGIPLGNLTSQIFANIYLNELDQFIKHKLKMKYYIRYADDFIILDTRKYIYCRYTSILAVFLKDNLKLELHQKKIILKRFSWGIDFLGYIVLPHYFLVRTKTKKRVIRKIKSKINSENFRQSFNSYLGHLSHADSYKFTNDLKNQIWLLFSK